MQSVHKMEVVTKKLRDMQNIGQQLKCSHCDYEATKEKFLENHIKLLHDNDKLAGIFFSKAVNPIQVACQESLKSKTINQGSKAID